MSMIDFLSVCFYTLADGIKHFGLLVHAIAVFNYDLVSSIVQFTTLVLNSVIYFAREVIYLFSDIGRNVLDFLLELVFCAQAVAVLLWKFFVLIWHILAFIFSSVELVALTLWAGIVMTVKTITQTFVDVADSCGATWLYGKGVVGGAFSNTVEGFWTLGTIVETVCSVTWNTVVSGIIWVCHSSVDYVISTYQGIIKGFLYLFLDYIPNIRKETYLGVVVCCIIYLIISNLFHYMHSRGLTIPFVRIHRGPETYDDTSDEEIFDSESETNFSEDENDRESVGTAYTIAESADGSGSESEGEGSGSEANSESGTSDPEIDIQLAPANTVGSRGTIRRHADTPVLSDEIKASMSRNDLEREIEKEKDKRACVVCQDRPKNVLVLPCRHMCLCLQCANQIVRAHFVDRRVCPLCRTRIKTIMDVYV